MTQVASCLLFEETERMEIYAPNYENIEDRMRSFTKWPLKECIQVYAVAETGMYYSGKATSFIEPSFELAKNTHCFSIY